VSVVFIGTSEFAAAVLERMAGDETHRPALVLTRPDRPRGRGRRLSAPPVAERAKALGIPLEQPASVNDPQAMALIAQAGRPAAEADGSAGGGPGARRTVVVCSYGELIKEPLLSEHEVLNVHPSLLPRWRGAAPVERALMAGDEQTGISIMRLTAGLDSGPVCLAAAEAIRPDDTYGSLAERLQQLGGELILRALHEAPPFAEQPQEGVTYAEKIGPADRLLDPARPAIELERVVRALYPHIGARVALADGTLLGVHRAALLADDASEAEPAGERSAGAPHAAGAAAVGSREGRLLLQCSPGVLELLVVQPPGGRPMEGSAYLRGHGLPGRR
jgi:methionyl-tRNA formyltransferase